MKIDLKDNSQTVLRMVRENIKPTLAALGTEAVGMIVHTMQGHYNDPIWRTGDLQRDVSYEVERSGDNTVDVGNSLEYAIFVHDGTRRMAARPYIKDALLNESNQRRLQEIAKEGMSTGFK